MIDENVYFESYLDYSECLKKETEEKEKFYKSSFYQDFANKILQQIHFIAELNARMI